MGGWSPEEVERAKNTLVPEVLKCSGCKAKHPRSAFSATQITKLKNKVAMQGKMALERHSIRCNGCTGGTVLDGALCVRCHQNKPLEAFTKTQRRDADKTTCKICTSELMTSSDWASSKEHCDQRLRNVGETSSSYVGSTSGRASYYTGGKITTQSNVSDDQSEATGVWIERAITAEDIEADETINQPAPESFTGRTETSVSNFSGWNSATFTETEDNSRVTSSHVDFTLSERRKEKRGGWAKVKSHDPHRMARIIRASDPTASHASKDDNEITDA